MHHVAIDIGASGGTVYVGRVTPTTFDVEEVYRFDNRPVKRDGRYVWDLDLLQNGIEAGLRAADKAADGVNVIGIDTWGLDFALLRNGDVLRDPVSYRDPEATATRDALLETVGKRRLFDATGITHWNTPNTLWQLHTIAREEPALLDRADELLMMPQLLTTLLGGRTTGEVTIASTTQMVDPGRRDWATDLLEELSLPTDILPPLTEPGERLGPVNEDLAADLSTTPNLVSTASHDTASAVAGLPLADDAAFLNTGSWFIMGIERDRPLRTDEAFELSLANELGVDGTIRLLRNVDGFFLLEECRKAWATAGDPAAYDVLIDEAKKARPRAALVDPDADSLGIEGSMPDQIRAYCRRTDQPIPGGQGEIVRCLIDSLVTKTAVVCDQLAAVTGSEPSGINLGGGGVQNDLFCQLLADATGRPVWAGPTEATAIGNLLMQAVAVDTLPDIELGRRLIAEQFETTTYEPANTEGWENAKERMETLESA